MSNILPVSGKRKFEEEVAQAESQAVAQAESPAQRAKRELDIALDNMYKKNPKSSIRDYNFLFRVREEFKLRNLEEFMRLLVKRKLYENDLPPTHPNTHFFVKLLAETILDDDKCSLADRHTFLIALVLFMECTREFTTVMWMTIIMLGSLADLKAIDEAYVRNQEVVISRLSLFDTPYVRDKPMSSPNFAQESVIAAKYSLLDLEEVDKMHWIKSKGIQLTYYDRPPSKFRDGEMDPKCYVDWLISRVGEVWMK